MTVNKICLGITFYIFLLKNYYNDCVKEFYNFILTIIILFDKETNIFNYIFKRLKSYIKYT